jgi:hypothetical protein
MTWQQTYSGKAVSLLSVDPSSIEIEDIAVHLSRINRYNGATTFPYSVAQHSRLVCQIVRDSSPTDYAAQLWAVLHDAHEFVTGDKTRPFQQALKALLPTGWPDPVKAMQECLDKAIAQRFCIDWHDVEAVRPLVHRADNIATATEKAQIMLEPPQAWDDLPPPCDIEILQIGPVQAEFGFMLEFERCLAAYKTMKARELMAAE